MKKFLLLLGFLSSNFTTIQSQKPFYHKNKAISWVGETEFTYYLEDYDRLNFEPPNKKQEETRTIKLDPFATCEFGTEKYFTNFLINEILENRRKVFSLKEKPMTISQITNTIGNASIETTKILDPITNKESLVVVKTDPISQIKAFKVRQWWYYNDEKESLESTVRAIAPILIDEQEDGSNFHKIMFWVEMIQDPKKDYNYNDKEVIWAKETLSTLSFNSVKRVKGRTKKTIKNLVYKNPKNGKTHVLENDGWYPYCAGPIDVEEVNKLLAASTDTLIILDSKTYTEKTSIVRNPKLKFHDFNYMRVLQHWYFDKSANTLASKVISIGPLLDIQDKKGNLKYRRALYYIKSSQ